MTFPTVLSQPHGINKNSLIHEIESLTIEMGPLNGLNKGLNMNLLKGISLLEKKLNKYVLWHGVQPYI